MRVSWTDPASADLVDIADYVSDRNVRAAMRFVDSAESVAARLQRFPRSGRALFSGARDVRTVGFGRWVMIYEVVDNTVRVLRVVDGSRDLASVAKRLD